MAVPHAIAQQGRNIGSSLLDWARSSTTKRRATNGHQHQQHRRTDPRAAGRRPEVHRVGGRERGREPPET